MSTFRCTLDEFKVAVAEFTKAVPSLDIDQLENGLKAVHLLYLGLPDDTLTLLIAKSYLEFAQRRYFERDFALTLEVRA